MKEINITIRDKIAENVSGRGYVCGNSDYTVIFDFDSEWDEFDTKTARFIKQDRTFTDVVFTGNECPMPILSNTYNIYVGVFAGDLHTTTPAHISAKKSILCDGGTPAAPSEDVYSQIMELLSNLNAEITTKTGTVVQLDAEAGAEITIATDASEPVVLWQTGKNLIQANHPKTVDDGVDFTIGDDGKLTFTGTINKDTGNASHYIDKFPETTYLPAGTYALSGTVPGAGWQFTVWDVAAKKNIGIISSVAANCVLSFTLTEPRQVRYIYGCNYAVAEKEVNATVWVQLERGETATSFEKGVNNIFATTLPTTVEALNGVNTFYAESGDSLTATMKVYKEEGVNADSVNALIAEAIKPTHFDPTVYDIPVLTLDGDCTGISKEKTVSLDFSFVDKDGTPFEGTAKVKLQGASSIQTGKDIGADFDTDMGGLFNLTVKFPSKLELADGWGKHKKYCFKANAVDHSHCRNICSCKIWGQIVKSRDNVPEALSSQVNGGAIDGFPVAVMLNGKFYAFGTMNLSKDEYLFSTDTVEPKALVSAKQACDATRFKALATMDGDFDLEYAEEVTGEDGVASTDWVKTSLNTMLQAVIDSDGTDLDTVVGQYIDIPSAIDYYIYTVYEKGNDGTARNYLLVTFDGVKWYFSAYDRDTTYGMQWDGTTFNSPRYSTMFTNFADTHRLMGVLWTNKRTELKTRTTYLRKNALDEGNICDVFTQFAARIPAALLEANCHRWPLLRSTNANNVAQILNWYRLRCIYIDNELSKA